MKKVVSDIPKVQNTQYELTLLDFALQDNGHVPVLTTMIILKT